MRNFIFEAPTKIYFGEGQISNLSKEIKIYGKKVLLVYGGGSIKKIGIYDKVISMFDDADIEIVELSGVEPNPRITSVREGVKLCRENDVEVILAIGGGSTIDCAKAIAASINYDGDPWDVILDWSLLRDPLPLLSVLTLSATGSEMNGSAVISNLETTDKLAISHAELIPKCSILDPTYTYSVSKYQTASGTADIMSHIFEVYFQNVDNTYMLDGVAETLMKTCIKYGPTAVENPKDYEARANLMWAGTWAINGFLAAGKPNGWTAHPIEHELSAFYDITHGEGLAIITPTIMEYILSEKTIDKFVQYGVNVWGLDRNLSDKEIAKAAIDKTREFFVSLGLSPKLSDLGIDSEHFEIMAEKSAVQLDNAYVPLNKEEVVEIFKKSL